MNFISLQFLVYFLSILILVVILPPRMRWILFLIVSYLFYACFKATHLIVALAIVTGVSYFGGLGIKNACSISRKRYYLYIAIIINVFVLVLWKYFHLLFDNTNSIWVASSFPSITWAQPIITIGVSYYVFQGISYILDIYLEVLEPETHFGYFALYLSFFPKLLQGPIERGGTLIPQLRNNTPLSSENLRAGVTLFLWGMFKKVVVADRLAFIVDPVFNSPNQYFGLAFVIATYLFAFQIYFDFSGYTDMALGISRCLNIRLTQNFNTPYMAVSTIDFWRRWHISFSSWILDYIFKPLQLSFRDLKKWGTPLALLITFIVSGIWHGASSNFIVWGGLHGIYLSMSTLLRQQRSKVIKALRLDKTSTIKVFQVAITFHLICFAWIFFRAANMREALFIVRSIVNDLPRSLSLLGTGTGSWVPHVLLGKSPSDFIQVLLFIGLASIVSKIDRRNAPKGSQTGEQNWIRNIPYWAQGGVYGLFSYLIFFQRGAMQSFIYFQF